MAGTKTPTQEEKINLAFDMQANKEVYINKSYKEMADIANSRGFSNIPFSASMVGRLARQLDIPCSRGIVKGDLEGRVARIERFLTKVLGAKLEDYE